MSRPRAGVDLDGVVYDFHTIAIELLNAWWDVKIALKDVTTWDSLAALAGPQPWKWLFDVGIRKHGLFERGQSHRGSVGALLSLSYTHDIVVLTHRPETARVQTLRWLAGLGVPFAEVRILSGETTKSVGMCDWYVDDNPSVLRDLHDRHLRTYRMVRPWNANAPGVPVRSMPELVAEVLK